MTAPAPTKTPNAGHRPWCDQEQHARSEQDGLGMPVYCTSASFTAANGMGGWLRESEDGQTLVVLDWKLTSGEFSVEDAVALIGFLAAGLARASQG